MRATLNRKELTNAVRLASKAVSTRPTLPILGCVRLETVGTTKLAISTTDLEVSVRILLDADVETTGTAIVAAKPLAQSLKGSMPARATVRLAADSEAGNLMLLSGPVVNRHPLFNPDDFPAINVTLPLQHGTQITSDPAILEGWLRRVTPAVSDDDGRPVLQHLAVERHVGPQSTELTATATDSYRLHVATAIETRGTDARFLLDPAVLRLAMAARRANDDTMALWALPEEPETTGHPDRWLQTRVTVLVGTHTWISSVGCTGDFPKWREFASSPDGMTEFGLVEHAALAAAQLRQVARSVERHQPVKLSPGVECIRVEAGDPKALAASYVALDWSGVKLGAGGGAEAESELAPIEWPIGFNPCFLADAIEAAGDGARFLVTAALKPALLTSEGFTALVMPTRLPN